MEATIKCELDSVKKLLDSIQFSNLSDIFIKDMDSALQTLQDDARNNLASSGYRVSQSMIDGIQRQVSADGLEGRVTLRGQGKKQANGKWLSAVGGKPDYRTMWFDMGTRPRYINVKGSRKKRIEKMDNMASNGYRKGYRGQLRATNFFQKTMGKTDAVVNNLCQDLEKDITDKANMTLK